MKQIIRIIRTEERLFEVLESIKDPYVTRHMGGGWVPSLGIKFGAKGGVVEYTYNHSGSVGLDALWMKLDSYAY